MALYNLASKRSIDDCLHHKVTIQYHIKYLELIEIEILKRKALQTQNTYRKITNNSANVLVVVPEFVNFLIKLIKKK